MNTENMGQFSKYVSKTHKQDFIVIVLDGASSHKDKELKVPSNIALIFLPSYSPEPNPAEQIFNVLRRDYFANRVFDSLNAATLRAKTGLAYMAYNREALKSLTDWHWIKPILEVE